MLASSVPPKFQIPFAANAGSANIRAIPTLSQQTVMPGAASLTDGFPPKNFQNVAAGGIPPFGQDMNGILNQITLWNQWHAAGGPVRFDATFAAAIGGYPAGALVQSATSHAIYESVSDNNLADPNAGSTQWRINSCVWSVAAVQAAGSANIQTITLSPAPTSIAQLTGIPITILSQGTNTGPVTIAVNGFAAQPIQAPGGIPLGAGALTTGAPFTVIPTGSAFILTSPLSVFTDPFSSGITVDGTGSSRGANILLKGNGTVTPKKWLRAAGGVLAVINDAYTAVVTYIDDIGNLVTTGTISSQGNITANNGRFRASFGATGTGDSSAVPVLDDFRSSLLSNGWAVRPDGMIEQWGIGNSTSVGSFFVSLPRSFPNQCLQAFAQEANPTGWALPPTGGWTPTVYAVLNPGTTSINIWIAEWNIASGSWIGAPTGTNYRFWAVGF